MRQDASTSSRRTWRPDQAQRDAIVNNIKAQLGDTYTLGGLTSGSEFASAMQMGGVIFNMLGVLTLAMGGFIIFNTFRTIVAERRHDIGMLRTIGANRTAIISIVLTEGLVQGVVGTGIGIGLGYLLGAGMAALISPFMKQLMNTELAPPAVDPALLVVSIVLGVGVTLFSGLVPALNAESRHADGSIASAAQPGHATHQPCGYCRWRGDALRRHRGIAHRQFCARTRWAVFWCSSAWCSWRPRWSNRSRSYLAPCWR